MNHLLQVPLASRSHKRLIITSGISIFLLFELIFHLICSHALYFLLALSVALVQSPLASLAAEGASSFLRLIVFFVSLKNLVFDFLVLFRQELSLKFFLLHLDEKS